jgi:DNA-binding NtrC family response regulator
MSKPWEVVIAVSDFETRRTLSTILEQMGLEPMCVSTVSQCCELLEKLNVGLVFCGRYFADGDYRAILSAGRPGEELPAVVVTRPRIPGEHHEANPPGVFDVITAPCRPTDVEWAVIRAGRNKPDLTGTGRNFHRHEENFFGKTA